MQFVRTGLAVVWISKTELVCFEPLARKVHEENAQSQICYFPFLHHGEAICARREFQLSFPMLEHHGYITMRIIWFSCAPT